MLGRCEIAGNLVIKQDRYCFIALSPAILNLWVDTPLWVHISDIPAYQIFNLMILNTSKIIVTRYQRNNVMVGVTTTRGTALKSHSIREVENDRFRQIFAFTAHKWPV